jgi:choline kinase
MADRLSGAILAAGHGQRLRRAAGGVPKPLIELGGEPLLLRQIGLLHRIGANPIHVIINSETHDLMRERGLGLPASVELLVRDTANSMESVLSLGEPIAPGFFLLMTVDAVVSTAELRKFVTNATKIIANPQLHFGGALGVVKWRGDANPLFAEIADAGLIAALGRKESPMVTAGVYLLSTAIFVHAKEARLRGLNALRRFLALLLDKGMIFAGLEMTSVIDIDEAADLCAARDLITRES